jgi:probable HAF family extracellular repeat protein
MLARWTLLLTALVPAAPATAQSYLAPKLPDTAAVMTGGTAYKLNSRGMVAGYGVFGTETFGSITVSIFYPFLWHGSRTHPKLPPLAGDLTGIAYDVNEQGQAVGVSNPMAHPDFPLEHPVWWKDGLAFDLRTLVTGGDSLDLQSCMGIDEDERIVGNARLPGALEGGRGFLFEDGIVTDLGDLGGDNHVTQARALGADGVVLGYSFAPPSSFHAFAWKDGVMTDLHDPAQIAGTVSEAYDSNALGVICGSANFKPDSSLFRTAALWDHGQVVNLGSLQPGAAEEQSYAAAINDLSQVVGSSQIAGGFDRAFLWQNGVLSDLNDFLPPGLPFVLRQAWDITNDGRIVGDGYFYLTSKIMPFLLIPDCAGSFTPYATGCAGSGDLVPKLAGMGCPAAGQPIGLEVQDGLGGAPGVFALGLGQASLPITPNCSLSIAPLTTVLPFTLDGHGHHLEVLALPSGIGPATASVQAGILDTGAPGGISATNALSIAMP